MWWELPQAIRYGGPQRALGMAPGETSTVEKGVQRGNSQEEDDPAADNHNATASARVEIDREVAEVRSV